MAQIKKSIVWISVFLICAALLGIGASKAIANEEDSASKAVDDVALLDGANDFEETEVGLTAADENQNVTAQENGSDTECFFDSDGETDVSASFQLSGFSNETLVDGSKVKLDSPNNATAIIESAEGTVRTSFVIDNADASEEFTMRFNLPKQASLKFSEDLEGNTDGSVEAIDENGDCLFAIGIPWALDSKGNKLTTYYRIDGNTLTQVVRHKGTVNYPVVADPSVKFSGWFKSGSWGTTEAKSGTGAWSGKKKIAYLHLVPTDAFKISCVTSLSNGETANSFRSASWTIVKNKFKSSKKWKNEKSLKTQYYCHTNLLAAKGLKYGKWDINIEPARPNVSLATCAKYGCNP